MPRLVLRVGERKSSGPPNSGKALIDDAQESISECSKEIRTISYLLHPPTLDLAGLGSAIEWYSDGFSERSGIKVDLEVLPSLDRLPQDLEPTIYRLV